MCKKMRYLCIVFFMVLNLRLREIGCREAINFFVQKGNHSHGQYVFYQFTSVEDRFREKAAVLCEKTENTYIYSLYNKKKSNE